MILNIKYEDYILTTRLPEGKHVCTPEIENYLVLIHCNITVQRVLSQNLASYQGYNLGHFFVISVLPRMWN